MKLRTPYFDFLRGIAILMVIAIHTFPKCSFGTITGCSQILIRQIVGCPVPLFLALSGFFVGKKDLGSKQQKVSFWKKQIPKVYIPALFWSLFYFTLSIRSGCNLLVSIVLLLCMGYSIYYFIALIIQCHLLLPILQKADIRHSVGALFMISVISSMVIAWFGGNKFPLIVYAGPFTTWMVFFYIGIILSQLDRSYSIKRYLFLIPLGVVAMMVEAYALNYHSMGSYGLKPTLYLYSIPVILALFSNKIQGLYNEQNIINKIICYIGRISFGIYLTHCIVILVLFHYMPINCWLIKWFLTATISVIAIALSQRVLPESINKIIGFK